MSDREREGASPGFRVIDRRGISDEERAKSFPPPPAAEPAPPAAPAGGGAPRDGGGAPPSQEGSAPRGAEDGAPSPPPGNRPGGGSVEDGRRPAAGARRESRLGPPGFADLVAALQVPAMIHLGLMAPPGTGGRPLPPNLPAAKDVIDMLGVLQEKTKGNLDAREEEMLTGLLYELRMVYLEIFNSAAGNQGGSHP